ncbi:hypothetical protein CCYA_CCYA06G1749 [Cyanidiococcus yangmingshanensis]|nr:hypothetical protein CCYA_CCYA06G1749 [Cyanidiococcus yangmingshanensis]
MGQCASFEKCELEEGSRSHQLILRNYNKFLYEACPNSKVREIVLYCEVFKILSYLRIIVEVPVEEPFLELNSTLLKIYRQVVEQRQSSKKRKRAQRHEAPLGDHRSRQDLNQRALNSCGYVVRPVGSDRNTFRLCRRLHVELRGVSTLTHAEWAAQQSHRILKRLLPFGMGAQLWITEYNADGSVVADILRLEDRLHINRTLLVTGWGLLHPSAESEPPLLELERFAKEHRVGIWAFSKQRMWL